jgi:quinohemoprotein amine dehydrogenase
MKRPEFMQEVSAVSMGVGRLFGSMTVALAMGLATGPASRAEAAPAGAELVRTNCSGCHREHDGEFERISAIRKTPEGWAMTLARMRQVHGVALDDDARRSIVRYLADTQGLAPSESAAGRFALEQRPNAQDIDLGPELGVMCGRCHTLARAALQRRDEEEWRKLAHTHVGQWPSLEYQQSGRDRHWWDIASGPLPAKLAALYPYSTPAWTEWLKHPAADLSGDWVIVGRVPGGRDFFGTGRIARGPQGDYTASYRLTDTGGTELNGQSKAIVYTGYEWRGSADVGERSRREVYHISDDGNRIDGRWFYEDHAEDGGEWSAVRDTGASRILAVLPQSVRAGTTASVSVVGIGLGNGAASFGDGVSMTDVHRDPHFLEAEIEVTADAAPGLRAVQVGGASGRLAVYRQIDQVTVEPSYAIARLGGGRVDPVSAQFVALASTRLPDGQLLPLGPVDVVWSSKPFDAEAARTEDEKYSGYIDRRGRFLPSAAGPNPAREFSGDNVGNLTVVAAVEDHGHEVSGHAHLVVTVQRWITPPIY